MRSNVLLLLVGFALVVFIAFVLHQTVGASHDATWWKEVGIEDFKSSHLGNSFYVDKHKQQQGAGQQPPSRAFATQSTAAPAFLNHKPDQASTTFGISGDALREREGAEIPVKGQHYDADYDVSQVTEVPFPYRDKPYFRYVEKAKSKWNIHWVSMKPRVFMVPNFMTHAETDAIIARAKKDLQRSRVSLYLNDKSGKEVNEVRTSQQAWININDPTVSDIVDRICELTGWHRGQHEPIQVLRYGGGQKYDSHYDYFDAKFYGKQADNRAVTVFLYLNTVAEGGETVFPLADGKNTIVTNYTRCDVGLRAKPTKGWLAVFYDMDPNTSEEDYYSLHGGCKPKPGHVKWGATLWLRVKTP